MSGARELHWVSSELAVWQAYVPELKVDCTSTAIATPAGWLLVDPIPLAKECLGELQALRPLAAIVLTSGNHQRDSLALRSSHGLQIYAPSAPDLVADKWIKPGERIFDKVEVLSLFGAGPAEVALLSGETMIFGDGVINLGELALLPDKYCEGPKQLRESLRQIVQREFGTACFSHGLPITKNASRRIGQLLRN